MFCTHCGSQIDENMRFCTKCGQPVGGNADSTVHGEWNGGANTQQNNTQQSYQGYQQPNMQKPNPDQYKLVLQIFAGIFAFVFLIQTIVGLASGLGSIFEIFRYIRYNVFAGLILIVIGVLTLVQAVVSAASATVLGLTIIKCEKENSESFFTTFTFVRVISLALVMFTAVFQLIHSISVRNYSIAFMLSIFGAIVFNVIVVGGFYGILYLMGLQPLKGVNGQNLQETVKTSVNDVIVCAKSLQQNKQSTNTAYTANSNTNQSTAYTQSAQQNAAYSTGYGQNTNNNMNQGYATSSGASMMNTSPLKTDRSLVMYIILTFVTCGIYAYYFLYKLAQDVNIACDGDGESTPGLLMFILLSFVTCGIYAYYWYYKIANRLAKNAPRYGLQFQENGTTVLMWLIFGIFLCCIGSFIGINIIIKNTNQICAAYNRTHFYN